MLKSRIEVINQLLRIDGGSEIVYPNFENNTEGFNYSLYKSEFRIVLFGNLDKFNNTIIDLAMRIDETGKIKETYDDILAWENHMANCYYELMSEIKKEYNELIANKKIA